MKNFKSLFAFDRKQQRGIFVLMLFLIVVLAVFFYVKQKPKEVLSLKNTATYQSKVDSLAAAQQRRRDTIYPFNPNYITDYRGYKLGLNVEEIDRLHRFRETGKFINSRKDFQQVTQVSNQWLDSIAPYFNFPDWVTKPENSYKNDNT
jgi:competence protein ComEA